MDARGRASASQMIAGRPVGIRPNGSLDQAGRQAAGWGYSGVTTGAGAAAVAAVVAWTLLVRSLDWTLATRSVEWNAQVRSITWTIPDRDT